MNPDVLITDCDNQWYTDLDEHGGDKSSSGNYYHDDFGVLSSYSSSSPSPAHDCERMNQTRGEKVASRSKTPAIVHPVHVGQGIYYYGDTVSRSAPGSPASARRVHYSAPNGHTNGVTAVRHAHTHGSAASVKQYNLQYSRSSINAAAQMNGYLYTQPSNRRVHISNQREYYQVDQKAPAAVSGSKSHKAVGHGHSGVSCYSAFGFGSRSKKHKLPRVLRRGRSKSEKGGSKSRKSKPKSSHNSPAHSVGLSTQASTTVHPVPQKPARIHGYVSDCEGYRRSHRGDFLEPSRRTRQPTSQGGYCSDYELVRQHRQKQQCERNAKGYSSGYETTGSFFSGSEWSDEEEGGVRDTEYHENDVFQPIRRSGRTKSAGTLVLHKIAKKFSKMSVKSASGDGGEASDGSGGGSTSWSAKKAARRKKLRSNSVSNLDCPDE